jgi:hypothetical protein
MTKAEMLLGGPGLDGYVFHGDLYCEACGQRFIEALPHAQYHEHDAQDSDIVPQPIFFGESDIAQCCNDCGEYLYGDFAEGEREDCGDGCTNPGGHKFECTGTQYGGEDERWHGEGRCLCVHCGADGDG